MRWVEETNNIGSLHGLPIYITNERVGLIQQKYIITAMMDMKETEQPQSRSQSHSNVPIQEYFGVVNPVPGDPTHLSVEDLMPNIIKNDPDIDLSATSTLKERASKFMGSTFVDFANGLLSLLRRSLYLQLLGEKLANEQPFQKMVHKPLSAIINMWISPSGSDIYKMMTKKYMMTSIEMDMRMTKKMVSRQHKFKEQIQNEKVDKLDVALWKRTAEQQLKDDETHQRRREKVCFDIVSSLFQKTLIDQIPDIKNMMMETPPTVTRQVLTSNGVVQYSIKQWPALHTVTPLFHEMLASEGQDVVEKSESEQLQDIQKSMFGHLTENPDHTCSDGEDCMNTTDSSDVNP